MNEARQIVSPEERRWTAGAYLTLAVALVLFFGPLVSALIGFRYPSDGWTHTRLPSGSYRVNHRVAGVPSPLQRGDLILAINGQLIPEDGQPPLPPDLQAGQSLRYRIERAGQAMELDVTLVQRRPLDVLRFAAAYIPENPTTTLIPLLSLLIAALVFTLRPGSPAARYMLVIFAYYSSLFGFADFNLYTAVYPPLLAFERGMEGAGWGWLFFPSWTLLALVLPVRKWPLTRFPRLAPFLLYGILFAFSLIISLPSVQAGNLAGNDLLMTLFFGSVLLAFLAALFGGLIHNFRTLRGPVQRAQLRWTALGMGVGWGLPVVGFAIAILTGTLNPDSWIGYLFPLTLLQPVSMAVAILRYRLFDIDVIIRRTLVYAALTGLLGLVYFGGVTLFQSIFTALSSSLDLAQAQSPITIVLSTLAIAALFNPLRRRLQEFVDRRFYRRKYNAEQALASFAALARQEVDIEEISARLLEVVEETVQPERVGLWLKPMPEKPK